MRASEQLRQLCSALPCPEAAKAPRTCTHHRRVVAEWAIRVPVERAQLKGLAARRGSTPGAEQAAITLRELANEVHAREHVVVRARAVGQAVQLLVDVRARRWRRQVDENIQRDIEGDIANNLR